MCDICGTLVANAQLGIYQVQQLLGRGQSGSAYLAIHQRLRYQVVLKLFLPARTSFLWNSARQESLYVAQLRHNAILPVFSCAIQNLEEHETNTIAQGAVTTPQMAVLLTICQYAHHPFISFLSQRRPEEAQGVAMYIIQQIGTALSAVHERNITHGALHPGNLLFDDQEHLWLADFGLARLHPPPEPYLAPELYDVSRMVIQTGNIKLFWDAVNSASDQFAFGRLCQQFLPYLLQRDDYERGLPVLQRATQQQPALRFPTVANFAHELLTQLSRRHTQRLLGDGRTQIRGIPQSTSQEATGNDENTQQTSPSGNVLRSWASGKTPSVHAPDPILALERQAGKLFTSRQYDKAIGVYRQALALDVQRASIWLALGDALLASTQYTEALKAYERTIALNPSDALAWSNSGAALDALGRHREALVCYERANELGDRNR